MQKLATAAANMRSRISATEEVAPISTAAFSSVQEVVTTLQRRRSVVSSRTLARRLRIEKRALMGKSRKDASGLDNNEEKDQSLLGRQLDKSSAVLNLLIDDGKELINNVNVGNKIREQRRNREHSVAHNRRMQALEEEARLAEEKFQEINSKWQIIESFNDPLDINNASQIQREKCEELISQKNSIIAMLKKELEYEDFRFTADQEVQLDDISILVERIDNQINIMRRAYKNQLILIESSIDTERREMMEINRKQWELLNEENEQKEVSYIDTRQEKIEEHETNMIVTTIEYEEKCHQLKIGLENDIQTMQQKLEELKIKCVLNSEKLNYDYHVLRKRDEENIAIKAQQKRKINKLQEDITNLYQTLKDLTFTSEEERTRINGELSALRSNIDNISKKVFLIDRLIHEQQLNCPWVPPEPSVQSDEIGRLFDKLFSSQHTKSVNYGASNSYSAHDLNAQHEKLAKLILQKICDQTEFLLDKNIENLLSSYPTEKKTLVKLETVFTMLSIKSEEDIKLLKTYFMPYAVCTECSKEATKCEIDELDGKKYLVKTSSLPNLFTCTDDEKWDQLYPFKREATSDSYLNLISHAFDKKRKCRNFSKMKQKVKCCNESHSFTVETANVLKGLNDFIQNFHKNDSLIAKSLDSESLTCHQLNTSMCTVSQESVEKYWEQLRHVFSDEHKQLWNALTIGLTKYYKVLKERQKTRLEIEILDKENSELRKLLGKHIGPSKVKSAPSKSSFPPLDKSSKKNASVISHVKFEKSTGQSVIQVQQI